jgi:hypothetical protein
MLIYCFIYAVLALGCHQIILNSYGIVELYYENLSKGTYVMDWTIIGT